MLRFICECNQVIDIEHIDKMTNIDLLKEECYFSIIIDGKVFFEEPYFPIFEFLYAYINWDKTSNFQYITLETDDNPLISFVNTNDIWNIDSPWKRFCCEKTFTINELVNAVESIYNQ